MARVVVITGASSGIGRAAALAFIKNGDHVAGIARRAERLTEVQEEVAKLAEPHGKFLPISGDVTEAASMQAAVAQTAATFGQLDILVANAGVGHRGTLVTADWKDIETLLHTNIDGVLHSIRSSVPEMRKTGGGHIITISSIVYNLVSPYAASYAASKAFVSSLAKSIRIELREDNIRVTDFLVGRTQTEFNQKRLGEGARRKSNLPAMPPEKVAAALLRISNKPQDTVILRWLDRLIVWGNRLLPAVMGELAKRQYK